MALFSRLRWAWDREEKGRAPGLTRRGFLFLGAAAGAVSLVDPTALLTPTTPLFAPNPTNPWDSFLTVTLKAYSKAATNNFTLPRPTVRELLEQSQKERVDRKLTPEEIQKANGYLRFLAYEGDPLLQWPVPWDPLTLPRDPHE